MIRVNGDERAFSPGTVADLLAAIGAPTRGVVVAVDGEVVARALWETTDLRDGARVEVLTAAAGG